MCQSPLLSTIRAERARAVQVEEMYLSWNYGYLKILVPYLENFSEEGISESI